MARRFYFPDGANLYGYLAAIYLRMIVSGKQIPMRQVFRWLASLVLLCPYMRNLAKKILIADENDACRQSLGGSIKSLGYEVVEAATGPQAIDKASSMHPDLIMMDLRLPGMNATACNIGDRVDRALEAGAEEILYKPFHSTMLRDVLRTFL